MQPVAAAAFQAEQAIANARARASKLAAIDSILWNSNPHRHRGADEAQAVHAWRCTHLYILWCPIQRQRFTSCSTGTKLCRSLARHAAYQLISRLTVDIQNVSAAFNLDAPIASLAPAANFVPSGVWHPRAAGSGPETSSSAAATPELTAGSTTAARAVRFQPDEPLGSCARVSLRSLTVNSATPQGYGVLATVCQLSGVDLAVDRPHAAGAAGVHCVCMHPYQTICCDHRLFGMHNGDDIASQHQTQCCLQNLQPSDCTWYGAGVLELLWTGALPRACWTCTSGLERHLCFRQVAMSTWKVCRGLRPM